MASSIGKTLALILGLGMVESVLAQLDLAPTAPPSSSGAPTEDLGEEGMFGDAFFLQMGFSFIVGLAIGYALKIAFKIALIVGGIVLFALFSLQLAGLIDVNWGGMESHYDGWADWISIRGGALLDFMADNLTNAVSFFAGLALGLKL